MGAYAESELALSRKVLGKLREGMLCLADRNFFGYKLWNMACSTGADLVCRLKKNQILPCERRLRDGSYLSTVHASQRERRQAAGGVPVRVVEYRLEGVEGAEPLYRLATSVLDPERAPARELAALYHERWEIETAFDELKTHLRGSRIVLRSKKPDLVRQEFYGLLLAHFAVRKLMHEAALQADLDPDRLSFLHAVRVVRRKLIMADKPGPVQSFVLERGQIGTHGKAVEPGTPAALHTLDPDLPRSRLGLAQWITSPENPLTARVTVNRIWAEVFGRGIVASVEDFGRQVETPTHPELLDWLAVEFVDGGWSIKNIVRLIVTTATYRQSSRGSPAVLERDPDNTLLAVGPRFRLPAEAIRDAVLAASGLLSLKMGGPPVHPPQPDGLWEEISTATDPDYPTSKGEDRHRRGIYTVRRRGAPYPSFTTFDASARQDCVAMRARTNSPLQALTLLNDPVYVEAADALAKLVMDRTAASDRDRLAYAFRRAVTRTPSAAELRELARLLDEFRETSDHEAEAWVSLARVLLNLDETISKG